jgi:hypothetical protein
MDRFYDLLQCGIAVVDESRIQNRLRSAVVGIVFTVC